MFSLYPCIVGRWSKVSGFSPETQQLLEEGLGVADRKIGEEVTYRESSLVV